ncbi:MAG: amidohydrolase family protein [Verrucomicrobiota bacterium]|nr:amidohydrolase family protein [Verrucomicrobiota bacterium]
MIIRARALVTMDGAPIENGAIAVAGNKIVDVGSWPDVHRRNLGQTEDLGECVLLPGLINAHCHLDYTELRGQIAPQASFAGWIGEINARKADFTADDYLRSIACGFAEAAQFGTTTIANLEAFPELLPRIPPPPLRTWWFGEMIDVRAAVEVADVHAELRGGFGADWCGGIGLAPHALYTVSGKLYAEAAIVAAQHQLPITTHLAESREEMAMFRDGSGPLFEFLQSIGRPMSDCGATTPLALLLQRRLLDERWIVAHLNDLTAGDFRLLESAPKFHIVHCPRSHAFFGHTPFALEKLRALGFNICLGTDSLASNESLSMFAEMRQLAQTQPSLSPCALVEMVTTNAASALGQQDVLGRLRVGHLADAIALPFTGDVSRVYEEIVEFAGRVPWLLVNGRKLENT